MDYFDEINKGTRFFVTAIRELPHNDLEVAIVIPEVGDERDVDVAEGKTLRVGTSVSAVIQSSWNTLPRIVSPPPITPAR